MFAAVLVALLIYARVPQVVLFLAAAGLRKRINDTDAPELGTLLAAWSEITPRNAAAAPNRSRCGVTYHHWYHGFEPHAANACLAEIAALGASHLRLDIRWKDVLPNGVDIDPDAVSWYRSYLKVAKGYGLTPHVVLSNPPRVIERMKPADVLKAWNLYLQTVVSKFGDMCNSYQLMNEINSPVFRFVHRSQIVKTLASGAAEIRKLLPDAQLSVNIIAGLPRWRQELSRYRRELRLIVDVVAIDFYPGTWSVAILDPWREIEATLAESCRKSDPELPRMAIAETGYATNLPIVRADRQQEQYFRRLRSMLQRVEGTRAANPLAFIMLYEICDENSSMPVDPEAHFGILGSQGFRRKQSFTEIQGFCASFPEPGLVSSGPRSVSIL